MKLSVEVKDVTKVEADAIIIGLFESAGKLSGDASVLDKKLKGAISRIIEKGQFKGKYNDTFVLHTLNSLPAGIVAIAGLGKKSEFTIDKIRSVMGQTCRTLRKYNCQRIATVIHGLDIKGISVSTASQAIAEGTILGLYHFNRHVTKKENSNDVKELVIVDHENKNLKLINSSIKKGQIIAEAANFARDMENEPSNFMTPTHMAAIAKDVASKYKLNYKIFEKKEMQSLGMGALLGVARGSDEPPKMMILHYRGNPGSRKIMGYLGKGITFDSGGISIKPSEGMGDMKGDMSGGASVIAAMSAIAQLKPKVNITAIVPATENMPSGHSLKPGDIIKASNGKTIEVVNTDAEGRLILSDALSYAVKLKLSPLIDVATLTGACQVALGGICSGIFTNNQNWLKKVIKAGDDAGERLWQLPMYEEYKEQNKSDVADVKNSGGRYGGAITAAQFLSEFVADTPWVHVDIAGTDRRDSDRGYMVKGASGVIVRTLINLAIQMADTK
jgi:leucyl aminopeptidase